MEAIGVVLGAVALLDPAYKGLRSLRKAYKIAKSYGEDFERSIRGLRTQEWNFVSHLWAYEAHYSQRGADALHGSNQELLKRDIALQIDSILRVLDKCYEVVRHFDQEDGEGESAATVAAESGVVAETQLSALQPRHKFVKLPDRSKIEENVRKYWSKIKRSGTLSETAEPQPLHPTEPFGISEQGSNSDPSPLKDLTRPLENDEFAYHKQRVDKRIEDAQKRISRSKLGSWVDHGREEFEGFVSQLRLMNSDLERILPLESQLKDVFATIRRSNSPPALWEETKTIRSELDGLHKALSFVNCAFAENGPQSIPFAVKVEEDFEELRSRAEDSGIISSLPLTREPMLICLMPRPDGLHTENDFILSTPVTVANESRITNLPHRIAALKERNQDFDIIGNIEHSARETWIYHLQRVEDVDLIDGHYVSALVEDDRLRQKERICLAAGIARSYLHYMEINPGKCHGPLNNYRLFVQESPATGGRNWALPPSSSLWVEFGFGSSTASKTNKFLSKAQYQEKKISPAVELGVLLYQVTAAESLTYHPTAEGLHMARQTSQDGLSKVEQLCGLFMRDVVAACLMDLGNRWEDKDVVEEVASALMYHAAGLRNAASSL